MVNKNQQEQIITKEELIANENIKRVDNRPGSIYSIVIFVMLFLVVYFLYPQISMILPIPGEKVTVKTGYQPTMITEMLDAKYIFVATVSDESDSKTSVSNDNSPVVYRFVSFNDVKVLKGEKLDDFNTVEYGGNGLFQSGGSKKKYNVAYENAAQFDKGKTYLLFVDENYEVINGRAGALLQNDDETFTDIGGYKYSLEEIKALLGG